MSSCSENFTMSDPLTQLMKVRERNSRKICAITSFSKVFVGEIVEKGLSRHHHLRRTPNSLSPFQFAASAGLLQHDRRRRDGMSPVRCRPITWARHTACTGPRRTASALAHAVEETRRRPFELLVVQAADGLTISEAYADDEESVPPTAGKVRAFSF
jgi:hypothetical protein